MNPLAMQLGAFQILADSESNLKVGYPRPFASFSSDTTIKHYGNISRG
jgi:hypothetical protein